MDAAAAAAPPAASLRLGLPTGSQPRLTLSALWQGPADPAMRFLAGEVLRATHMKGGPATLRLRFTADEAVAEAWGQGAHDALERVPALLGLLDEPSHLSPQDRLVGELARRFAGLRMTRAGSVYEPLLVTIIGQKLTSFEARRSYRRLLQRWGRPAPGPGGLLLAPAPEQLARLPYHLLHPLGLERRRADALRAAAGAARALQRLADERPEGLGRALASVPGIGPWSTAEVLRLSLGDPDAVSLGDYNLPNLVGWALAGERRANDARMLELLEPYRGQRARVVRLIELSGLSPARRGPRLAPRSIASI